MTHRTLSRRTFLSAAAAAGHEGQGQPVDAGVIVFQGDSITDAGRELFDAALRRAPVAYWSPDGVHPGPAGSQLMADAWLRAFREAHRA